MAVSGTLVKMRRCGKGTTMRLAFPLVLAMAGCTSSTPIDASRVVDLTYPFNDDSIYWPTAQKFSLTQVAWGRNGSGHWYASNDYAASEHGGTHLDAPIHFAPNGWSTAEIPVARLIGPVHVIDVRRQCNGDRNYQVTVADIETHETVHGAIEPGSIVLLRTGFGRYYSDVKLYLGSDVRGSIEGLSFPGFGQDAARALVDRRVDMVGLDTASLDYGASTDFAAHRIFCEANVPGLENVANLDQLPPVGATLIALPMKIEDGTGGPCRIIAFLP